MRRMFGQVNNRNYTMVLLLIVLGMVLLSGCGRNDETLADANENVVELNDKEDVDIEAVEENEDDDAPFVVTDVVYDFDNYESVDAVEPSSYSFDDPIKGLYVSAYIAGSEDKLDNLIEIADETEINAFVIDVKNDNGNVTFEMDLPEVNEVNSDSKIIRDIDGVMDKLYEHNIYPIARIVTFKDPYLAKNKQEYAIKNQDGSLWYYNKVPWLNPYNKDTWAYVVDIAKEAAAVGFKEIQFDYIRFEATSKLNNADFGGLDTTTRKEIILEFVQYATSELKPLGVEVSADVFGIVINSDRDAKTIGQNYVEMSKYLDVICPMVYPSHYGFGFYGAPKGKHSDLYPYETIYGSMMDSNEELAVIPEGEHVAGVRPWLQAFTASYLGSGNYMVYGKEAIRAQIQATYDAGLDEWLLWNASNNYNSKALLSQEDGSAEEEKIKQEREAKALEAAAQEELSTNADEEASEESETEEVTGEEVSND